MLRFTARPCWPPASVATAKADHRACHATTWAESSSSKPPARSSSVDAACAGVAIARSCEVTRATTFSTRTARPGSIRSRSSWPTTPGAGRDGTRESSRSSVPLRSTRVRAATAIRTPDQDVATSTRAVPWPRSSSRASARCRPARAACSATLRLRTSASTRLRTVRVPLQSSASKTVSCPARWRWSWETNRRVVTRVVRPASSRKRRVRVSTPVRRSRSWWCSSTLSGVGSNQ